MIKLNKKGFVLAETLVVSIFVLLVFVLIYRNGVPMLSEYEKFENYDDIDSIYVANMMKEIIKNDSNYNEILSCFESTANNITVKSGDSEEIVYTCKDYSDGKYIDLSDCNLLSNSNLCKSAKQKGNITGNNKILLTFINPLMIKSSISNGDLDLNRGLVSYIDYLNNKYQHKDSINKYQIIISRSIKYTNPYMDEEDLKYKEEQVTRYASLEVGDTYE